MKVQYNKQTKMSWSYLPTNIVRLMDLKKGDEIEYLKLDKIDISALDTIFQVRKKLKTE